MDLTALKLNGDGLLPVVVADHLTGEVRMVAFANLAAVEATVVTGRATFFSRSRNELWEKGKTSGNSLAVRRVLVDCDADCLVYEAEPAGPSCHTGAATCFFRAVTREGLSEEPATPQPFLLRLEAELESRKASDAKASYTKSLYDAGVAKISAKIAEEAGELGAALLGETDERVVSEAADVLYHVLVGLRARGVPLRSVLEKLDGRMGTSGHEEKASRLPR